MEATKMSLEEFLARPGDTFHDFHELHNGQVVEVPAPTGEHVHVQTQVEHSLRHRCWKHGYMAAREFYMTLPAESRRVDVALVTRARFDEQRKNVFFGSPELVVEILSPSTSAMDLDHLREMCFQDQCVQFWVVNLEFQIVTVYDRGRVVRIYAAGQTISLQPFGVEDSVPVESIFEGL